MTKIERGGNILAELQFFLGVPEWLFTSLGVRWSTCYSCHTSLPPGCTHSRIALLCMSWRKKGKMNKYLFFVDSPQRPPSKYWWIAPVTFYQKYFYSTMCRKLLDSICMYMALIMFPKVEFLLLCLEHSLVTPAPKRRGSLTSIPRWLWRQQ